MMMALEASAEDDVGLVDGTNGGMDRVDAHLGLIHLVEGVLKGLDGAHGRRP